ncbi:DUF6171 family protein [Tuwongella immobilis]|uniref:Glycosyltransferase 2-like domain-containing protein n=1 Tax=Tuwongella immobilis TaxID=692036 RepID=A0A6C2YQQ6_9BACT|nr:DUF6171 family protein [Tuwongella immobilis]VIP03980.1 Glycosyl transferase family 2 OS=Chthoniobacter flavus Ellin428 GN=CfE428DRAFT_5540 PE=4 SV=1: Glycos_transf_2 [Tuwongella immobilis]VTS05327.1 Glycosyl transferase family 2 OS=Chthoniobacter flavus Ellin428 GN=CfE428DRAFT_5540 PE=4 SV=1: Glycos_transf_2 [Tuwongella immobilis]
MKLTIGMATYDDFDGVYLTIDSILMYHPEILDQIEIIVVDTNSKSEHGEKVRDYLGGVQQLIRHVRYIEADQAVGTAAPRELVFRLAQAPAVLCVDCHVTFPAGTIQRLIEVFDRNPDSKDLYSGPTLTNSQSLMATHFSRVWREGMLGIWAKAWQSPDGQLVTFSPLQQGIVAMNLAQTKSIEVFPEIPWEGHELPIWNLGYRFPEEPIEIPAMGLGAFACRKEAFPGFNLEFKGFGGEEWYLHEKVRRAGGKCIYLPWLLWKHRFGRVGGTKYRNLTWDRVRNYVIGHKELGWPLQSIYNHFVRGIGIKLPVHRLQESDWEKILAGQVDPDPVKKSTCGACQGKEFASIEDWFTHARDTKSDINQHVETLRRYASEAEHVTEFGVRAGVSTVALLAGQPKRLVSYDVNGTAEIEHLQRLKGTCDFEFRIGDSRTVDLEPTDLLFIDTKHTAEHLWAELQNAKGKVRRWIILHDTEIFGSKGEDGSPGLMPAVQRWTRENREWTVIRHETHNNGLTVLSCDSRDKQPLPNLMKAGINFTKAMARHVVDGRVKVTEEQYRIRLETCDLCPIRNGEKCGLCGCPVEAKALLRSEDCPSSKWPEIPREGA